jgi:hypothetical protein
MAVVGGELAFDDGLWGGHQLIMQSVPSLVQGKPGLPPVRHLPVATPTPGRPAAASTAVGVPGRRWREPPEAGKGSRRRMANLVRRPAPRDVGARCPAVAVIADSDRMLAPRPAKYPTAGHSRMPVSLTRPGSSTRPKSVRPARPALPPR